MKIRKIGNSLGATFGKEALARAGFTEADELEVQAVSGEIRIKRASKWLLLELTPAEAKALAAGNAESKAGKSARAKVRKLLLTIDGGG